MDFATIFRLEENLNLDKKTLSNFKMDSNFWSTFFSQFSLFFFDLNFPVLLCHIIIAYRFINKFIFTIWS